MSGMERELQELENTYKEKKRLAIKSGMDTVAITKQFERDKSLVIAENTATQLAAFSQLAGSLSVLAGDNKELAAAGAIIDTFAGANKAFREGGTLGFVTGAAIIAAGLANVQKIYDTPLPGSAGGGTVPATPAPQMMSGAFELSGGVAPEPLQAFVLTDSMTNSQNQLANIRRRATI